MAQYKHEGPFAFGSIIHRLREGAKARRAGWNGKNMFVFIIKDTPPIMVRGLPTAVHMGDFLAMYTMDGIVIPWTVSQTDALARDWEIIDEQWFRDSDRSNAVPPVFTS